MKISKIGVHHSAGMTDAEFEAVLRGHLARGFTTYGYHFMLRWANGHLDVKVGRPHDGDNELERWEMGAGIRGHNRYVIHDYTERVVR